MKDKTNAIKKEIKGRATAMLITFALADVIFAIMLAALRGKQFEYNTYIRDFFEDNRGASLVDAIKCRKYKKSLKGRNKYERSDLKVLEQII